MDITPEHLAEIRAAITDSRFSHARNRSWCGAEITWIYHRDPASPTGVKLASGGEASVVEPMMRELRKGGPLSPTEGLA